MLPDPLHPAVAHLPLALAVLTPLFALLAGWAIHSKILPLRIWVALPLLAALMAGSGWLALETGEDQEDRVEEVVVERYIEEHEERAETFAVLAATLLAISFTGLLPGRPGELGRAAVLALSVVTLGFAIAVGHTGGELVYRHGAAQAYVRDATGGALRADAREGYALQREHQEEEDDD